MSTPTRRPLDEALWNAASPAITELVEAARSHIASGGWCISDDLPTVKHEVHWPWLSVDSWSEDRPNKWSSLFGPRSARFSHVILEDLPKYQAYLAYARSREDLRNKLLPPPDLSSRWFDDLLIERLVLDTAVRVLNLGPETQRNILTTYLEAEKAILAEVLTGELLIPLSYAPFPPGTQVSLSESVLIRPLTDDEHRARARKHVDAPVPEHVVNSATHALVVMNVKIDNASPWTRLLGRRGQAMYHPGPEVERAVRAVRIATGQTFGYCQVLIIPHGWADSWTLDLPLLKRVSTTRSYPPSLDSNFHRDAVTVLTPDEIDNIAPAYDALGTGNKRLNLAARRLDLASQRFDSDDVVIDCAVGFEALLGGDRNEIAHRVATRASVLLRDKYRPDAVYRTVRRIYDRRSEIVHGTQSQKNAQIKLDDATFTTSGIAMWLLREVLKAECRSSDGAADPQALDDYVLSLIGKDARMDARGAPEKDNEVAQADTDGQGQTDPSEGED